MVVLTIERDMVMEYLTEAHMRREVLACDSVLIRVPATPLHLRLVMHLDGGYLRGLVTQIDYVVSWPYSKAGTLLECKLSTIRHPYDVATEAVRRACALSVDTLTSVLCPSGEERLTASDKDQVRQFAHQPILL